MIKDRILWLLWLVCMAGAAVITGTWLFAAVLLLTVLILIFSAGSVVLSGKKSRYQTASPKGIRENGVFPWKNVFGKSVCMAGIWRGRSAQMGKSFYRGKRGDPDFFFLGGKEKQVIGFEAGSNWCGCIRFCFSDWKCQDFFRVFSLKRKLIHALIPL